MNSDWVVVLFIINLSILAYVRYNFANYISLILFSTVNSQSSNLIFKDNKNNKTVSFILNIFFYITTSIFILQVLKMFFIEFVSDYFIYIIPASILLLFFLTLTYKFINLLLSNIFLLKEVGEQYNHNITVFNQALSVLLFPITILISYSKADVLSVYIGLAFFFIIYILKIIRLFIINISQQLNFLYLFLYLCTFEIMPILYLLKILKLYNIINTNFILF